MLTDETRPRDQWVADVLRRELTPAERDVLVVARLLERLAEVDASIARIEP